MTHKCVDKQTVIVSDKGLSPGRRLTIIWPNAGILFIEPLGKNFSEIAIEIHISSFEKYRVMHELPWITILGHEWGDLPIIGKSHHEWPKNRF